MKKRKLFGLILLLVLLSGLVLGGFLALITSNQLHSTKVIIEIEDIDKQGLTSQEQVKKKLTDSF